MNSQVPFDIKSVATKYVYGRFPDASKPEKDKIIRDWVNKIKDSQALVRDFVMRVGEVKGKSIFDAGCGNGGISIAFALAGAQVTAVEIEQELFDIARAHVSSYGVSVDIVLYDGTILPFKDNSFDYAISASVIEHTTDPVLYLSEIHRVLKKDGVLYLGFPNKYALKETHTQIWFLTYIPAFLRDTVVQFLKRNPLPANNLHFYSYFDLQNMLKKVSGFFVVKESGRSSNPVKKIFRSVCDLVGFPYKVLLPHILVLLKKQ